MATKVNSVELYKSMSEFFRNVRYVNMVGDSSSNEDVSSLMTHILRAKDEFKRNVGKINASSVHRYPGQYIGRELETFKAHVESAKNKLNNEEDSKLGEALNNADNSLNKVVEEFNSIKGA